MAKDLTQMPTDKLFKRIEGAVAELQRRFVPVGDVLPRTQRVAPGIRVQADTYGEEPSPEDAEAAAAATLSRRLTHSKRVPVADPVYLAAFESARRRPAPKDEVRMADMNGILAPVTTGEAE